MENKAFIEQLVHLKDYHQCLFNPPSFQFVPRVCIVTLENDYCLFQLSFDNVQMMMVKMCTTRNLRVRDYIEPRNRIWKVTPIKHNI